MNKPVPRETRICLKCGRAFEFRNSPSREARGKYCSRSCGASVTSVKHGHATEKTGTSPTYRSYWAMMQRCYNENSSKFGTYGGVGISVAERWKESFQNFLADMGERPDGATIDRFPNQQGNYEPGNCRWATAEKQQQNIKSNRLITSGGRTMCASEWARALGVKPSVILYRINSGWSHDDAVSIVPRLGNRIKSKQIQPAS